VAEAGFKYFVKGQPADIASSMARSLHTRPPIDMLSPPSRQLFDPVGIAHVLQSMTPTRMLVTLVSSAINASSLTQVEPVYRTSYASSRVPDAKLQQLSKASFGDDLHLPIRNPFIPTLLEPLPIEDKNSSQAAAVQADPDEAFVETPLPVAAESIALALRSAPSPSSNAASTVKASGQGSGDTSGNDALARFSSTRQAESSE